MPLPFKTRPQLSEKKRLALVRLKQLKRKFERNPRFKDDYITFMDSVFKDGDAERADNQPRADQNASRWLQVAELMSSTWLTGPKFLWEREIVTQKTTPQLMVGDPEVKKHPVILPRDGVITCLIIGYCHEKSQHQGRGQTLNELRAHEEHADQQKHKRCQIYLLTVLIPHHHSLSVGWIVFGPFLTSRVAENIRDMID
ncbi:hypothetical protein FQN60_010595 [Etheostoma spectabile]|uniref:Uncharacterized protein n=1 Tax=Etheostoma spectabile TaxID=54343 RepID=A0A5J5CBF3_9PERO|nr:hypothetical protein FQN60_010595 [Etheostoma spectabile]